MRLRIFGAVLAVAIAFLAFVSLVWPTAWRYDKITYDGDTYPVRINRFTGDADILLPGDGWTPAEEAAPPAGGDEAPGHTVS